MIRILAIVLVVMAGTVSLARADEPSVQQLMAMGHDARWNSFVDQIYALHKKLIAGRDVVTRLRVSGYYREPKFYREVTYIDRGTGRVISRISWERAHPDRIHVIQVYIYDRKGKVIRDYAGAYRTTDHQSPMATEINLHAWHGGLHAFRQFNASNEIILEKCTGTANGRPVKIELDADDLAQYVGEANTPMTTPEYKLCFGGLPHSAGKYLIPQ